VARIATSIIAVPLLAAAAGADAGAARARAVARAAPVTFSGELFGVAAATTRSAWAVGSAGPYSSHPKTLIVHWNGTRWARVPSPAGAVRGQLWGVAATSASSAWAVGSTSTSGLILRWNGARWTRVPGPRITGGYSLSGVAATSASSAWAVGSTGTATLTLRWNGTSWKRVPSPNPGARGTFLSSVTATSARNAWAVGETVNRSSFAGLILHWNGTAWRRVTNPMPKFGKYGNTLRGVAASSATNAWAVGCTDQCPVGGTPVIEKWNGSAWKQVAPPTTPYALYNLTAVATTSARSAWAVGGGGPVTAESAATLHWNGHDQWTLSKARSNAGLTAVAATSANNAWAVGGTVHGRTMILHWNGTTWKVS
jgi:hypothetical protein